MKVGQNLFGATITLLVGVFILVGVGSVVAAEGFAVSGALTQFGEPVEGAKVLLDGNGLRREAQSAADGTFRFGGVPAGEYRLVPTKSETSFLPAERVVRIEDGGVQDRDVQDRDVQDRDVQDRDRQNGDVSVEEFRSVPYPLPTPKMDPRLGEALPMGGGEGYTLTPKPADATHVVEPGSVASLLDTLEQAEPGDLVYLPPGEYFFDDPEMYGRSRSMILVPAGVTLFGLRDETILRTLPIDEVPSALSTFGLITMGPNTRLSGLTIIGPDTETGPLTGFIEKDGETIATAYYKPTARGIEIQHKTEIDNISITGFPYAAILVHGSSADAFVHHSYIGENVRTGLGYGVVLGQGGYAEVAFSKFYRNRHSMDSRGGSYYVHDSHFDNENPMGIGMIFQHAQEMSGAVVIQDNTIVNGVRGIHMFTGHGVISGNVVDTSAWGIALRRWAGGNDRHGELYKGWLHDYEIYDNDVRRGDYYFEGIRPQDNVYLDGINVGNLLAAFGRPTTITIPLETWNSRLDEWRAKVPAAAPRVHVHVPQKAERPVTLRGMFTPEFDLVLPDGWRLSRLELLINDESIYRGDALPSPEDVSYDTLALPNGMHEFKVVVDSVHASGLENRNEEVVTFRTDNFWDLLDEVRAPIVSSGWFGTVDLSKTSEESEGWTYVSENASDFFGDHHRKVRQESTTREYLVWETPRLREYMVTLYARQDSLDDVVSLSASTDGEEWTTLPFVTEVGERSAGGWYRITYSGILDWPEVTHFRLMLRGTAPGVDVQVGSVKFVGLK